MELTVRKTDLLNELRLCQGIVERKNTIPILSNVLLEANGDGSLRLLSTDLEVSLRSRCAAAVADAGAVTVPARKLYELVQALPETEITISAAAPGGVKVSAERFDSRMQTLPHDDFPTVPNLGDPIETVRRRALHEMVVRTQFAITGEDTRYFLNGALFVLAADAMTLVATDGHRLALAKAVRDGASTPAEPVQAILPRKTLLELARLLAGGPDDGDVRYVRGENHLFFDIDGRLLISRMIDAQFPAYERVIPTGNDTRIEFDRDRLAAAIRRVALLSSERSQAVRFRIAASSAEVESKSAEVGEAKEVLPVEYAGADLHICFNAQYVLDFLGVVDTDSVTLELKDDKSQAIMYPAGGKAEYTYVIMPMRL